MRELIIRVNGLATPLGLRRHRRRRRASGADAILLPKVESADAIRHMEAIMRANGAPDEHGDLGDDGDAAQRAGIASRSPRSTPRMACLVMGTSDLAKELDCAHTRERLPFITSLGLCLLAARAYGLAILDGVYLDLNDDAGFEFACRQGARTGLRRQDADSSEPGRRLQPGLHAVGRGRRVVAQDHRRARRGGGAAARAWWWSTAS